MRLLAVVLASLLSDPWDTTEVQMIPDLQDISRLNNGTDAQYVVH